MTVTFVVGDIEEQIPNSVIASSEYVENMLAYFNTPDITIDVKNKYVPVFNIYLAFLHNSINSHDDINLHNNIKDINTLMLCFDMESYFIDNEFFRYLMDKAYSMWNEFVPLIAKTPDERLVYLYSPYEFVPTRYMDKDTFFDSWLEINSNVDIVLNGNDVYHTDVTYYDKYNKRIKELVTYHTIGKQEVGYKYQLEWYKNQDGQKRQLRFLFQYRDGKINGLHEEWYENGKLNFRANFKDGKENGLLESWYENGQIYRLEHYKDGRYHGLHQRWYANDSGQNGKLVYQANYDYGKKDGLQEEWYDNGQLKYKENYKHGKRVGLNEYWNKDGQITGIKLYDVE